MSYFLRAVFFLFAVTVPVSSANALEFYYERFTDIVARNYPGWTPVAPFFELPTADNKDPEAKGRIGGVWNFGTAPGAGGRVYFVQAGSYCNGPTTPVAYSGRVQPLGNFVYRIEYRATGEIVVRGATPDKVIFRISALDAQYIRQIAVNIRNPREYYLPGNRYSAALTASRAYCGGRYNYALKSVIAANVEIKFFVVRSVSSTIELSAFRDRLKINLGLKAAGNISTEGEPAIVFDEGVLAFAVKVEPLQ